MAAACIVFVQCAVRSIVSTWYSHFWSVATCAANCSAFARRAAASAVCLSAFARSCVACASAFAYASAAFSSGDFRPMRATSCSAISRRTTFGASLPRPGDTSPRRPFRVQTSRVRPPALVGDADRARSRWGHRRGQVRIRASADRRRHPDEADTGRGCRRNVQNQDESEENDDPQLHLCC